jgi:RNA polymerase sigma-70 factor (ECF subfamily)
VEVFLMSAVQSNVVPFPVRAGEAGVAIAVPTDSELDADAMRRLARGEIGALGEIYDRHHVAVRRFIARATGSVHDADDLVHTTFLTLTKVAASFDPARSCRAWLLGIAARVMRRHRTAAARLARALFRWQEGRPASPPHPEPALHAREELLSIQKALRSMSEKNRITIFMADVEGLSCEEISAALDIPIGTVWRRLHDARRKLAATLSEERS